MPRVATKLSTNRDGSFSARKRIPEDVQSEYERLYGVRCEARFNSRTGVTPVLARAMEREWRSEIEARIASIRAERKGGGRMLTPKEARTWAGEWYRWFTGRHLAKFAPGDLGGWEEEYSAAYDVLREALWGRDWDQWPEQGDPFDLWEENAKARASVRAMVADRGETAQFLHTKQLTPDPGSRDMFLDYVCKDYFAALELLIRRAKGDYGADKHSDQFPAFERSTDPGLVPWALFTRWIEEAKPADATVDRWRCVFLKLKEDFASCAEITPEAALEWARGLINSDRSERTVRDVWVIAARTVFGWAKDQRLVAQNPFTEVRIKVPRKNTTRETKAFTTEEARTILRAALAIAEPRTKMQAAKRWVPWLCAYTGARGGEIAQLRGVDCAQHDDGVWAIRITPAAGAVKMKKARTVPVHEHLIEQGFLKFAKASGKGPLFYNEHKEPAGPVDPTNPRKRRFVKAREHIADWVRDLGVNDPEVQPNHAWRHTFKQICERCGITEKMSDVITGHAPASVARGYGAPTLADKAAALKLFPRYTLGEATTEQRPVRNAAVVSEHPAE
jgi:integrase